MAVLQIVVLAGSFHFKAAVEMKKFVACGDQDIATAECNAAQAPVATTALEVYLARVPVDHLRNILFLKIDHKYAAVTLALAAAAYDGCRDESW